MHDAQLHARLRIGRVDRFGKTRKSIDAGHEDVAESSIFQIGQARKPELGPLIFRKPQAEQLLASFEIYA